MNLKMKRLPIGVGAFVATQCRAGVDEYGGQLSALLLSKVDGVPIEATYSFVGDNLKLNEGVNPAFGGVSSPDSVVQLGRLCAEMLRIDGDESVLLLEELLMRKSDPEPNLFGRDTAFFGDKTLAMLFAGSSAADIADAFETQYPYPGVSVLSRFSSASQLALESRELSVAQIESIVDSAVLIVVSAWDGEGHIFAPLDSRTNDFLAKASTSDE